MAQAIHLDPRFGIEVYDAQENDPHRSDGALTTDNLDKVRVTLNDIQRRARLNARREATAGDLIPLVGSMVPDFTSVYIDGSDCESYVAGDWTLTQATTGTAALAAAANGVIELDSNSTTADQGVQVQRLAGVGALSGAFTAFGCRVKITDTIDKCQFFAGLCNTDTTIFASGALSPTDWIGFFIDAAGAATASVDFGLYDGVAVEEEVGVHTAVEDTYFTAEFATDGTTAWAYIDNVLVATITIADLPDGTYLRPSFCCLSEGTNDPIVSKDWWYVFQGKRIN